MTYKILVVDDVPRNVKLLADILAAKGYEVVTAASGPETLKRVAEDGPDLLLLDVMMPGMSGYEVCGAIRSDPATRMLPIVLVTALDGSERVRGLDCGADDFITKPINQQELLARVRSLLRIKSLYDEVRAQRSQLEEWNHTLERRVAEGIAERERLSRLKRFFSPQVANLILSGETEDPLRSHRSEITVLFVDLRGYTEFTDNAHPEQVMNALREYHGAMGRLIMSYQGTLERFAGDSIMIFFNDPVAIANPAERAVRMALEMHRDFRTLAKSWQERGHNLNIGIGIAHGLATLGAIGFEGRLDYGAIGSVCIVAARLCAQATAGQTLVTQEVLRCVETLVEARNVGELDLKGFHRPTTAFNVSALRTSAETSASILKVIT